MAWTALTTSSHLVLLLIILGTGHATENHTGHTRTAEAPGDIMIGILYPLHKNEKNDTIQPEPVKCIKLLKGALNKVLILINAIEKNNKSPLLTDVNVTLGYRVLDYCSDVSTALRFTTDFMQQDDCHSGGNTSTRRQPIMAVIGPPHSEDSIVIARQLTLNSIPQISHSSTAVRLSDKNRFPTFLRTVPSDKHQTTAMISFIQNYNWNWVGIVTTDDEYGQAPLDCFVPNALVEKICVAFKIILPASEDSGDFNDKIRNAAQTICNHTNVRVIISFARAAHMKSIFQEMDSRTLPGGKCLQSVRRVWLASDSWSSSGSVTGNLTLKEIGHIVGFMFKNGDPASFTEYLSRLEKAECLDSWNNSFLQELYNEIHPNAPCNDTEVLSEAVQILRGEIQNDSVFSLEMAVSAVAHAVASLCRSKDCKTPGKVQPFELLQILKKQKFELGGKTYNFTEEGDLDLGYDVTLWRSDDGELEIHDILAEYDIMTMNFDWTSLNTTQEYMELKSITSRCSNSCLPGTMKKTAEGQHVCCYECANCPKNHYSNETDRDQCEQCPEDEWSAAGSPTCTPRTVEYFSWDDGYAITLVTFTALGIILVLMVSALFVHQADTPVVKAAGGPLCQVILFSLIISYISAILFVGKPNSIQCKSRQVLFGISFTLCVSCILVKSLKILLAFQFNPELQDVLRRLYQPYVIIGVVVAMQVIICTCWLLLGSPKREVDTQGKILLEQCNEGSKEAFWVMLAYIAILAFVCFVCAFKGRRLPQQYNQAKFITFSMLLYLISWTLFIPIHVTTKGKYLPAVEMVIILISNYGILSCHFFPKCYIILFKKEKNTTSAFRQNLYEYSNKAIYAFSLSGSIGSESQSSCQHIATSALTLSVPAAPLKPDVVMDNEDTDTPVRLYPALHVGSVTRHLRRRSSL
ncbi:hypothetical protein INR49_009438 [Caranx melampygus]|nr:hypothetical protein INR49_009438 [Caranx melampygus]